MMHMSGNTTSTMSMVLGSLASLWRRPTAKRSGSTSLAARSGSPTAVAHPTSVLTPSHHGMRSRNNPRPPLRIVRVVEAGAATPQSGRMRISGRMADVCAELDRMVDREATLLA